jgi:uncharacterized membrane protein YraQ (UPF0718 family)
LAGTRGAPIAILCFVRIWATVYSAICIQATPYVVLGALLAAALTVLPTNWQRRLPRRDLLAVPTLGLAGAALPGCECGSVPASGAMVEHGVGVGPAVAFMVSAPATNPVVLAATSAAFPGEPMMVAARLVAGFLVAVALGALASRRAFGAVPVSHDHKQRGRAIPTVIAALTHEVMRALGLLSLGAAAAASALVWVPQDLFTALSRRGPVSVVGLAMLATLMCICSQADAFIARSFAGFSRTAQLTFMVVGPVVDLKLISMHVGAFGARFAARFALAAFAVAVVVASAVSAVLL